MHTMTILIATDLENSNKTAFASQILPDVLKDKKDNFSQSKVSITVKGQLIWKCLFGVVNFLQKKNENKST